MPRTIYNDRFTATPPTGRNVLTLIERCSRISLWSLWLVVPCILWGALSARSGAAKIHDWLPDHRPERIVYDDFLELFGDDQYVLVSWEGCCVGDPRCDEFRQHLLALDRQREFPWLTGVTTTADVLQQLTDRPLRLNDAQAAKRLTGFLLGKNGTACLLIEMTAAGVNRGDEVIDSLYHAGEQTQGLAAKKLILVGPLFEEVTVDRAGDRSLRYLVPPSSLAAILVAIVALGKWRASVMVFLLAGIGQLMSVALIYYTDGEFSAVMIVLPTLVFMLTLSSAVHLVNYFRDVPVETKHRGARALLLGLKPTVLATLTTMVGMGSLGISELGPVRNFGLYSAAGLGIATFIELVLFTELSRWLLTQPTQEVQPTATDSRWRLADRLTVGVSKYFVGIALISIILLAMGVWGVTQLTASTKFDRMFAERSSTISGMQWFENNIGPIVSVEVLLSFPDEGHDLLQQVRWLTTMESELRSSLDVGGTMSAADYLPAFSNDDSFRATTRRIAYRRQLEDQLPTLKQQHWFANDADGVHVWRITCKVTALNEDYGFFVKRLRDKTDEVIQRYPHVALPPEKISITGLSTVAYDAQVLMINDLGQSFLMAFLLITPMMIFITRNLSIGLLAMLPNVLPVLLVFGSMGWLGVRIDIASILTASVALGIAVDDTLHFISWYQRGIAKGLTARDAIQHAYRHCAMAMIETTLICCAAMVPLMFADFVPTQRFAMLMVCMVSLAIIGDMLLLPALLLTRDWFRPTILPKAPN